VVLAALALVAACSTDDASSGASQPTTSGTTSGGRSTSTPSSVGGGPTPGSSPAPYLPVPDGVVLTDPGSELGLGEQATVAWQVQADRVGVLAVKVRGLVKADIKQLREWQLDVAGRASSLYFVTMTVANMGSEDLSGRRIPLYVLDDANELIESSAFKTEFEPCPSPALPRGFAAGEKVTVCQAYLVPRRGELKAVSFRPTPSFNPITWVGRVRSSRPSRAAR
jgi:hypothetical protein